MRAALFLPIALGALVAAMPPAGAKTIFHATCGSLHGRRVDMDPDGPSKKEDWKDEFYKSGPPPDGTGTLEFISDDDDRDRLLMRWTEHEARSLPIVYRSESQITVADVDEFGVWMFTLYYRAGKVLVSRQTTNPGPGAIGAILVGACRFAEK